MNPAPSRQGADSSTDRHAPVSKLPAVTAGWPRAHCETFFAIDWAMDHGDDDARYALTSSAAFVMRGTSMFPTRRADFSSGFMCGFPPPLSGPLLSRRGNFAIISVARGFFGFSFSLMTSSSQVVAVSPVPVVRIERGGQSRCNCGQCRLIVLVSRRDQGQDIVA